jgi:hypothetical protein
MSWQLYRWTWQLEAPLHVGFAPAGSLNRCRLYVPARALWGALTAELARHEAGNGDPDYRAVGERLRKGARFSYLYPAEFDGKEWRAWLPFYQEGKGLVWKREDRRDDDAGLSDRRMRARLVSTRVGTAIEPESLVAADASLRETECMNMRWRKEDGTWGSSTALVGYVALRIEEGSSIGLAAVKTIVIGGDTRYGLGRLRRGSCIQEKKVFGCVSILDDIDPLIQSDLLLAHGDVPNSSAAEICGQCEAMAGWEYGNATVERIGGALWVPGSRSPKARTWVMDLRGYWLARDR